MHFCPGVPYPLRLHSAVKTVFTLFIMAAFRLGSFYSDAGRRLVGCAALYGAGVSGVAA